MTKQYDKAYFDKWYRGRMRVNTHAEVRRKVAVAIATSEYILRRQIRTVLDVGCGEGGWLPHLQAFRPRIHYHGIDPSDYAVRRYGKERNIEQGTFGELPDFKLGVYDLVVCSDVLHYVADEELKPGIRALAAATDGIAFLEVLTKEDDIVGDLHDLIRRPAATYRRLFHGAGLTFVGPYCWAGPAFRDALAELEQA